MPMIDLTFVRGSLNDQALGLLTDELVAALLRAERAPDTPFLRDNTLVYLHALDPAAQSVGGRGAGAPLPHWSSRLSRRSSSPRPSSVGTRSCAGCSPATVRISTLRA